MQDSSELTQVRNKEQNFEEWPVLVSLAEVKSREGQWVGISALARNRVVGIRNAAFLVVPWVSGLTSSKARPVFPSWPAQLPGRNAVHIRKLAN